jgi:hypothetical protein
MTYPPKAAQYIRPRIYGFLERGGVMELAWDQERCNARSKFTASEAVARVASRPVSLPRVKYALDSICVRRHR